jgi:hypothetical protein
MQIVLTEQLFIEIVGEIQGLRASIQAVAAATARAGRGEEEVREMMERAHQVLAASRINAGGVDVEAMKARAEHAIDTVFSRIKLTPKGGV